MRGTHQGQQSARTAPTGRTHDCKRPLHHAPHDLLHGGGHPHMNGWGSYELLRRQAEAAAEHNKPQPVQFVPQPGSVEWFEAERKKKG